MPTFSVDQKASAVIADLQKEIAFEYEVIIDRLQRVASNGDYIARQEIAYFAAEFKRLRQMAEGL